MQRCGFTLVEMLVVVGIVMLGMAIAVPGLGAFVQGNAVDQTVSVLSSVLTAARSHATSEHKYVAAYIEPGGEVRLYEFPTSLYTCMDHMNVRADPADVGYTGKCPTCGGILALMPPVEVSNPSKQALWDTVVGVQSWRLYDQAVLVNGSDPWDAGKNDANTASVILIGPNGLVLEGATVSPAGAAVKCGTSLKLFARKDMQDNRGALSGADYESFIKSGGRNLYINRITAEILHIPGGDEMIIDPKYADP
jgi:prepilin-type N-terminal cleavage/methylation domain-containing protein